MHYRNFQSRQYLIAAVAFAGLASAARADTYTTFNLDSALATAPDYYAPYPTDTTTETVVWDNTTSSLSAVNFSISSSVATFTSGAIATADGGIEQSGLAVSGSYLTESPTGYLDVYAYPAGGGTSSYGYLGLHPYQSEVFEYGFRTDQESDDPYMSLPASTVNGNYIIGDAAAVPEPASLAVVGIPAAMALLRRRRVVNI